MTTNKKWRHREVIEKSRRSGSSSFYIRRSLLFVVAIALVAAASFIFRPNQKVEEFVVVGRADLIRDISVTGKVKALKSVTLSFERSGRVEAVVAPGARVRAGGTLASLDNGGYSASLKEARGALEASLAELENLISGVKPEEISVFEAEVFSAKESSGAALRELILSIRDGEGVLSDVLEAKISGVFTSYQSGSRLNITLTNNLSLQSKIEIAKKDLDNGLRSWVVTPYVSYEGEIMTSFSGMAVAEMEKTRTLLDDLNAALNGPYSGSVDVPSLKSAIVSSRASITSSLDKIRAAKDKYVSAKNSLEIKSRQLELKKSGATVAEITAKSALVKSAEGRVEAVLAEMEKGIIRSPISGIVAKTEIEVGETAVSGSPVVSVISDDLYIIEANIVENDISKIKIGDLASVTLDAYGADIVFTVKVASIDPGETILEGVATYRTVFEFTSGDNRIKSGMTANIDIRSGEKKGVIALPQRLVITKNGGRYVLVPGENGELEEVAVEIGFRSSDGYVEIVSGLQEGDRVVLPSSVKR